MVTEPEKVDVQPKLAMLGELAERHKPRLFCLYGKYRLQPFPGGDSLFIGWGMEFPSLGKALCWAPEGVTSHSDSAASLFEQHQMLGDAHLVWLDDNPD